MNQKVSSVGIGIKFFPQYFEEPQYIEGWQILSTSPSAQPDMFNFLLLKDFFDYSPRFSLLAYHLRVLS
ncbi:MAG: hypothetical protein A2521_02095 [Deltaproteobacteria bacterium RIFOXYD12_FULL_57_12]|nr:MAG: hypothetical protein A2521_02095 [Deltaproteobacteria bacterium RIFOXYD12_FULL_57_12]